MKLCYSTLACPDWNLRQIIDGAVSAGLQGVDFRGLGEEIDISKTAAFTRGLDKTLGMMRDMGLAIPCINTSVALVTPAADRWQTMLGEFQRYARLASRCGTRFVRVLGGRAPKELSGEEAMPLAIRHLRQLVKIAQPSHCMPLLETHDDWSVSSRVMEALHEFSPSEAGVLWDVELPFREGEKPLDTAQALQRYLRHIHIKDGICRENKSIPRLLGEGDIPLARCMAALRAVGYDDWICLESEKRWHVQETAEPEVCIPQFAYYMRKVLNVGEAAS